MAVHIWSFGKEGGDEGKGVLVSHVSHRDAERGCAKRMDCVNSLVISAWNKEMERTSRPQGAKVLERFWGRAVGAVVVNSR